MEAENYLLVLYFFFLDTKGEVEKFVWYVYTQYKYQRLSGINDEYSKTVVVYQDLMKRNGEIRI